MPANVDGKHVDARPYNLNDGFSPGQPIVLKVPGLNSAAAWRTGAAPINHIGRYRDRSQPIVRHRRRYRQAVADLGRDRLQRDPAQDVGAGDPPGENLPRAPLHRRAAEPEDGRRRDDPGPGGVSLLPRRRPSDQQAINAPPPHFEGIFQTLRRAGIGRRDLYLAWDFTVASDRNIAERVLHMRNDAFAQLGDTKLADAWSREARRRSTSPT